MPDEFCVPDGNDFSDTGPDIVDSDSFDVTSDSSVDDLSDIMTDSVDTLCWMTTSIMRHQILIFLFSKRMALLLLWRRSWRQMPKLTAALWMR